MNLRQDARRVLHPPLGDRRFWIVQAMVVGLAAAHLVIDLAISPGSDVLPAGIPVALLLVPVSYAALHHGLSGSTATALWAALLWLPDLFLPHNHGHVGNDLTELALVIAVAAFVGYHIDAERSERARVHRFARLMHDIQDEERRRIARTLHDEPLQQLVHLARSLDCAATSSDGSRELVNALENARSEAVNIADRLRAVVGDLRPPALDQLGLVSALGGFLVSSSEVSRTQMDLNVVGSAVRLPPEIELAAFRIAHEAVNNVIRHAEATHLWLTITFERAGLRLVVADDGCGFDVPGLDGHGGAEHFGLVGMYEQAALWNGRLKIRSTPGKGTVVTAELAAAQAQAMRTDRSNS